jgi:hypothetical protein
MVVGEPDPYYRPEEIAEDGAFLGVGAVLDFLRGQGLSFVGGEIGRQSAAPEVFGYRDDNITRLFLYLFL